ncbi:hypothetical protein BEN48_17660 [Hymenobacter glacialis]|uniref:Secretion system C-terminal sorting domain-containing protein n=2 Tax=Hymenobacter glacialis TaxID=1908236 RepID=A0A1G1SU70_9BACT|nr:hypothetical protein BEN48_17660 [Hymenobacter glacialis]
MTLNITSQTNTGAVTYIGEQQDTPPNQAFAPGSNLTRVSFKRYFQLAPSVAPTGFAGTVKLSFDLDDFANYPADPTFVIAKNDAIGSAWSNIGRSSNTGTSNGGRPVAGTLTSASFNAFALSSSNFSLASTSTDENFPFVNPLPVTLARFAAALAPAGVHVTWATATEKNNDRFEVQRSANGQSFQTIGTVKGQGNSSSLREYAFVDSRPFAGQSYYRLRQVDIDGTVSYSPVAVVASRSGQEALAYPNPSTGTMKLPASAGIIHYRIFNALGQTLLNGQAAGNETIDLTKVPKGPFFLEMSGAAGRTTQRLVRE